MIDDKIGAALNRNLGSPTAPGEAVEAELDRLIERRFRQKDPEEKSELWKAGVSTLEGRRRQTARLEWHQHHTEQAERLRLTFERLISYHENEAQKLLMEG